MNLSATKLRFSRWGEAFQLALNQPDARFAVPGNSAEEMAIAKAHLEAILDAFDRAKSVEETFGRSPLSKNVDLTVGQDADVRETSVKYLLACMKEMALRRQKQAGPVAKFKWACYRKKKFDDLIAEVGEHVNNLVDLFPPAKERMGLLVRSEVETVAERDAQSQALRVMGTAAREIGDEMLVEGVEATIKARGHSFSGNNVISSEGIRWGDDHAPGDSREGASHEFEGNTIKETKNVRWGNNYGYSSSS